MIMSIKPFWPNALGHFLRTNAYGNGVPEAPSEAEAEINDNTTSAHILIGNDWAARYDDVNICKMKLE